MLSQVRPVLHMALAVKRRNRVSKTGMKKWMLPNRKNPSDPVSLPRFVCAAMLPWPESGRPPIPPAQLPVLQSVFLKCLE